MVWGAVCGPLLVIGVCTIGSIVLLMPEKTHGRAGGSWSGCDCPLELFGRFVAERRVQTAAIIVLFDEHPDV